MVNYDELFRRSGDVPARTGAEIAQAIRDALNAPPAPLRPDTISLSLERVRSLAERGRLKDLLASGMSIRCDAEALREIRCLEHLQTLGVTRGPVAGR